MEWPKVDVTEPFEAMEKRLGITKELDDVRRSSLGAHPSLSFYCNREPKMDIERMRAKFEKAARRY